MTGLFAVLFVAALVGVFRPYLGRVTRRQFGIAAATCFVLVGVTAPPRTTTENASVPKNEADPKAQTTASTPKAAEKEKQSEAASPPASPSNWTYSEDRDEMRGTSSRFASVTSENSVDLDFPYGVVSGRIWIRQRPEDGLDVAFQVDKGQVLCSTFRNSYVSIKFDDGPIQRFRCTDASDGSSETAFLTDARRALAGLRNARRVIVEAEFFQQGRQQFVFATAGLNWR